MYFESFYERVGLLFQRFREAGQVLRSVFLERTGSANLNVLYRNTLKALSTTKSINPERKRSNFANPMPAWLKP